jgi:hypothetical protein
MLTLPKCMERFVAYSGSRFTIEYAIRNDASVPAMVFYNGLDTRWQARLLTLFTRLGDTGQIRNTEQFNKFVDDFFEFKAFQIRMPCYFRPGKRVVITHGFFKKKEGPAPKPECERAKTIRHEYEERLTPGGRKLR